MSKQAVLLLAQKSQTALIPVADIAGQLVGYVRVVDLCLHEGNELVRCVPCRKSATTHPIWPP